MVKHCLRRSYFGVWVGACWPLNASEDNRCPRREAGAQCFIHSAMSGDRLQQATRLSRTSVSRYSTDRNEAHSAAHFGTFR